MRQMMPCRTQVQLMEVWEGSGMDLKATHCERRCLRCVAKEMIELRGRSQNSREGVAVYVVDAG